LNALRSSLKAQGYDFKIVKGSYKGTLETSVLVVVDTDIKLDSIRNIAFKDGQESILIVNEDRKAYLEYNPKYFGPNDGLEGDIKSLGTFKAISALEAKDLDNWTLDESESQYYGVS